MSSYIMRTKHPETGLMEDAFWHDDHYGHHKYGVEFVDGCIFPVEQISVTDADTTPFLKWQDFPSFKNKIYVNPDPVNHPPHYTKHPSGVECIEVTRHMGFNLGNAIKYIWRCDLKGGVEDLEKAVFYLQDEIKRRRGEKTPS